MNTEFPEPIVTADARQVGGHHYSGKAVQPWDAMSARYDRDEILARIQAGPVRYADLAGSRSHAVRKHLRPVIAQLEGEGLIRHVYIDRFPYYVSSEWVLTDEMRLSLIAGRCRPVEGCMVWTGYVDPKRGPMVRFGDEAPISARRVVWKIKRGALEYQETVRMRVQCERNCVEYTHMKLGRREDTRKGKNILPLQRKRIAETHQQQRSKLDWEKVRAIRASSEPDDVKAARYGVSKATIGQVRRGDTWREFGMFTGLLAGRAAA